MALETPGIVNKIIKPFKIIIIIILAVTLIISLYDGYGYYKKTGDYKPLLQASGGSIVSADYGIVTRKTRHKQRIRHIPKEKHSEQHHIPLSVLHNSLLHGKIHLQSIRHTTRHDGNYEESHVLLCSIPHNTSGNDHTRIPSRENTLPTEHHTLLRSIQANSRLSSNKRNNKQLRKLHDQDNNTPH